MNAQAPSPGTAERIIPTKNPKALAAYYCAIFGVIPCLSALLGPAALVLGILGKNAITREPALPGKVHAWVGILLGGLETLVSLAVIAVVLFAR